MMFEKPESLVVSVNKSESFVCKIVKIQREGKKGAASDAPVAGWEIDEDFAEDDKTIYRLSALDPNGVRFTAEMTAMDRNHDGYGWPAAMNEDLVIPTFEKLLRTRTRSEASAG